MPSSNRFGHPKRLAKTCLRHGSLFSSGHSSPCQTRQLAWRERPSRDQRGRGTWAKIVDFVGCHWCALPPPSPFMKQGNLNGRHANVTVCATRTGRAMARRFSASGARISLWDADAGALGSAPRNIANPGTGRAAPVDPTDLAPVKAASEAISAPFGKTEKAPPSDITVGHRTRLELHPEAIQRVMDEHTNRPGIPPSRRVAPAAFRTSTPERSTFLTLCGSEP